MTIKIGDGLTAPLLTGAAGIGHVATIDAVSPWRQVVIAGRSATGSRSVLQPPEAGRWLGCPARGRVELSRANSLPEGADRLDDLGALSGERLGVGVSIDPQHGGQILKTFAEPTERIRTQLFVENPLSRVPTVEARVVVHSVSFGSTIGVGLEEVTPPQRLGELNWLGRVDGARKWRTLQVAQFHPHPRFGTFLSGAWFGVDKKHIANGKSDLVETEQVEHRTPSSPQRRTCEKFR
jgi:hypothetical protein